MNTDDPRAKTDLARTLGELQRLTVRKGLEFGTASFGTLDAVQVAPGESVFAHLVVGLRGSLTRAEAHRAAVAFRTLAAKPNITIAIAVAGYDLDDRELADIPEAAEYLRRWARFAGVDTLASAIASPLHKDSIGVLGACSALRDFDADDVVRIAPPSTEKH
jgi:hypothetical protein